MKFKTIAIELLILLLLFILAWAIVRLEISHKNAFFPALEIELHDNFFVMPWAEVVLQPFLVLTVLVYLAKESFFRYKRRF
jgi:TRAP-type C4-dicarboxylate transport system permease small subunit